MAIYPKIINRHGSAEPSNLVDGELYVKNTPATDYALYTKIGAGMLRIGPTSGKLWGQDLAISLNNNIVGDINYTRTIYFKSDLNNNSTTRTGSITMTGDGYLSVNGDDTRSGGLVHVPRLNIGSTNYYSNYSLYVSSNEATNKGNAYINGSLEANKIINYSDPDGTKCLMADGSLKSFPSGGGLIKGGTITLTNTSQPVLWDADDNVILNLCVDSSIGGGGGGETCSCNPSGGTFTLSTGTTTVFKAGTASCILKLPATNPWATTSTGGEGCECSPPDVTYTSTTTNSYTIPTPTAEEGVEYFYIIRNTGSGELTVNYKSYSSGTASFKVPVGQVGEVSMLYFSNEHDGGNGGTWVSRYAITEK